MVECEGFFIVIIRTRDGELLKMQKMASTCQMGRGRLLPAVSPSFCLTRFDKYALFFNTKNEPYFWQGAKLRNLEMKALVIQGEAAAAQASRVC